MLMKFSLLIVAVLALTSSLLDGGSSMQNKPSIQVGENIHLDLGDKQRTATECWLAINPLNAKHLLAVAISANPNDNNDYSTIALASFDGGKTWKHTLMPTKRAADPWGIILPDGTAVVGDIGLGRSFRQMVYSSPDGGLTWRDGLAFGDGHDHDMFVYDNARRTLYLLSTRNTQAATAPPRYEFFLARSTDSGKTFPDVSTFAPFPNLHFNAKTPVLLSDGTLVIPFIVGGNLVADKPELNRWEHTQSWLVTSNDGGKSFAQPLFITDMARRSHGVFAVNQHPQWKDRLYYVFAGARRNSLSFIMSADKGRSWSLPKRLDKNTDAAAFVDLGAIAVNANGVVGVLWTDRIDDPARKCQYTYFTASLDGGETFLEPVRVSNALSCPEATNGWVGRAWPQGGDYSGLAARPDGSFLALWADARQGIFQLYTAEISLK
jgi:hypothetical protein